MVRSRLSRLLQAEKSLLRPNEVLSAASVLFLVRRGQKGIICVCRPWLFVPTSYSHVRVCQGSEITLFLDIGIKFAAMIVSATLGFCSGFPTRKLLSYPSDD